MSNRPSLDAILRENQNPDRDTYVEFYGAKVLSKERDIIREVMDQSGPNAFRMSSLFWAKESAIRIANDTYRDGPKPSDLPSALDPKVWNNSDGHRDAFRHAALAALTAREFSGHLGSTEAGLQWAGRLLHAHEGQGANLPVREAMDLYNSKVGLQIFRDNPNADPETLLNLVRAAVDRGQTVVINKEGKLAWSDQVPLYGHGNAEHPVKRPTLKSEAGEGDSRDALADRGLQTDPFRTALRQGVERLGPDALGLSDRGQVNRVVAALHARSHVAGLTAVDSVVASPDGQRVFAVQGDPNRPDHLRASVETGVAARQSVESSDRVIRESPAIAAIEPLAPETRARGLA